MDVKVSCSQLSPDAENPHPGVYDVLQLRVGGVGARTPRAQGA